MPVLAFLLASTNLVIELGILIFVFLSWQFVVGEYLGGLILIGTMWVVVRLTRSERLEAEARRRAERAGGVDAGEVPDWRALAASREGWRRVARRYWMEWRMVWKDVIFGFTVAGVIATFVPAAFFQALFPGGADPRGWQNALQTLVGPLAAFFTFIGSMGNVPLASVLFASGVSFAGVMAFLFSDLVVFPVLRISARSFGWKMAAYVLGVFLICLVVASLVLHAGFAMAGALPEAGAVRAAARVHESDRFALDATSILNAGFLLESIVLAALARSGSAPSERRGERSWMEATLGILAGVSLVWHGGGVVYHLVG